jgi:hypothetical protein
MGETARKLFREMTGQYKGLYTKDVLVVYDKAVDDGLLELVLEESGPTRTAESLTLPVQTAWSRYRKAIKAAWGYSLVTGN